MVEVNTLVDKILKSMKESPEEWTFLKRYTLKFGTNDIYLSSLKRGDVSVIFYNGQYGESAKFERIEIKRERVAERKNVSRGTRKEIEKACLFVLQFLKEKKMEESVVRKKKLVSEALEGFVA